MGPFGACELLYTPVGGACSGEWPITYLYNVSPLAESEPILLMDTHEIVEVGYCHSGAGVLVVEDKVLHFSAGDICVIGEQQMHMSRSEQSVPSDWSYFWIDHGMVLAGMPDGMDFVGNDIFRHPDFAFVFSPVNHEAMCSLVRDMVCELAARGYGHRSVVKGMASILVTWLQRLYTGSPQQDDAAGREGIERVIPAMHHMTSHYAEAIDVRQMAHLCSLSLRHFRRVFLAAVGRTPLEYLAQVRTRMAAAMLIESDAPISQIAYQVGFEAINTFNRQFRGEIGVSPSEWRQQRGKS